MQRTLFVIPKRFERLTHALEGRCSIQLSYGTYLFMHERLCLICVCKDSVFIPLCKGFSAFFCVRCKMEDERTMKSKLLSLQIGYIRLMLFTQNL